MNGLGWLIIGALFGGLIVLAFGSALAAGRRRPHAPTPPVIDTVPSTQPMSLDLHLWDRALRAPFDQESD